MAWRLPTIHVLAFPPPGTSSKKLGRHDGPVRVSQMTTRVLGGGPGSAPLHLVNRRSLTLAFHWTGKSVRPPVQSLRASSGTPTARWTRTRVTLLSPPTVCRCCNSEFAPPPSPFLSVAAVTHPHPPPLTAIYIDMTPNQRGAPLLLHDDSSPLSVSFAYLSPSPPDTPGLVCW